MNEDPFRFCSRHGVSEIKTVYVHTVVTSGYILLLVCVCVCVFVIGARGSWWKSGMQKNEMIDQKSILFPSCTCTVCRLDQQGSRSLEIISPSRVSTTKKYR